MTLGMAAPPRSRNEESVSKERNEGSDKQQKNNQCVLGADAGEEKYCDSTCNDHPPRRAGPQQDRASHDQQKISQ